MKSKYFFLVPLAAIALAVSPIRSGAAVIASDDDVRVVASIVGDCEFCETVDNEEDDEGGWLCSPSADKCHIWSESGGTGDPKYYNLGEPHGVHWEGPCQNCCANCGGLETLRQLQMGDLIDGSAQFDWIAFATLSQCEPQSYVVAVQ